jgi:ABC-2 type transport system ATP-binding protein
MTNLAYKESDRHSTVVPAPRRAAAAANAAQTMLACEHLTFAYRDGKVATKDLSLEIRRGELFCLLGPNGAGKTTLVRQLSGGLKPTQGRVLLDGHDLHADAKARATGMGVIPQSAGLFEGLSVEQHLRAFGPLKGLDARTIASEVERVLTELGFEKHRKTRVGALSGGQQRIFLVALAMLGQPKVLILDEPTVGLDPVARRALWETIEREKRRGTTLLLTTHYLDEAERLADRIGFIKAGSIVALGSLADLHREMGKSVRVTEYDDAGAVVASHYFDDLREARAMIQSRGLESYAVAKVSLEDIYIRFFGREDEKRGEEGTSCTASGKHSI